MEEEDTICRGCEVEEETLQHVVNCGHNEAINLDITKLDLSEELVVTKLIHVVNRILAFDEICNSTLEKTS